MALISSSFELWIGKERNAAANTRVSRLDNTAQTYLDRSTLFFLPHFTVSPVFLSILPASSRRGVLYSLVFVLRVCVFVCFLLFLPVLLLLFSLYFSFAVVSFCESLSFLWCADRRPHVSKGLFSLFFYGPALFCVLVYPISLSVILIRSAPTPSSPPSLGFTALNGNVATVDYYYYYYYLLVSGLCTLLFLLPFTSSCFWFLCLKIC